MFKHIITSLIVGHLFFMAAVQANEALVVNEEVIETENTVLNENVLPSGSSNVVQPVEAFEETTTVAKPPYSVILDKDFSPVSGASFLNSGLRAYQDIDDAFIPSSVGMKNFGMIMGRLSKYLLEDVLFSTGMIAQHEIFGHGARAREFNLKVTKYRVTPFSGSTNFYLRNYLKLTSNQKAAFITGGVEGTYILAKQLRNRWLDSQVIDEREGHFYLLNAFDQTGYVLQTRGHDKRFYSRRLEDRNPTFKRGDIDIYIREVNFWHRRQVLTAHELRRTILFDFADPYAFYSIVSALQYFLNGTQEFQYPMIPLGCYHYLPGLRIALAPYGPEYQFINYFRGPESSVQATFRYGDTGDKESYGLTIEAMRVLSSELLNFDIRVDLWNQPQLNKPSAWRAENSFGAAASLFARYRVAPCFELMGQLGYKTSGYIPGEFLRRTPILRVGFFLYI